MHTMMVLFAGVNKQCSPGNFPTHTQKKKTSIHFRLAITTLHFVDKEAEEADRGQGAVIIQLYGPGCQVPPLAVKLLTLNHQ